MTETRGQTEPNTKKQQTPEEQVAEFVDVLSSLVAINENLITVSNLMAARSIEIIRSGADLDGLFRLNLNNLSTVFQLMYFEAVRSKSDLLVSAREIESLQGKFFKGEVVETTLD